MRAKRKRAAGAGDLLGLVGGAAIVLGLFLLMALR